MKNFENLFTLLVFLSLFLIFIKTFFHLKAVKNLKQRFAHVVAELSQKDAVLAKLLQEAAWNRLTKKEEVDLFVKIELICQEYFVDEDQKIIMGHIYNPIKMNSIKNLLSIINFKQA